MHNYIDTLEKVSILKNLDLKSLEEINKYCNLISYKAGSMIFMSEDAGQTFYIVHDGRIKISLAGENGQEITVSLIEKGSFFGEMSILDEHPRAADVTALSDAKLLVIYKDDFWAILKKYPEISIALLKELCKRLRKTNFRIRNTNLSGVEKAIQALIELAETQGKKSDKGIILPDLTHQEWAYFAGISRETFTKSLTIIKKHNLITNSTEHKRLLIIPDIEKLRNASDIKKLNQE